jgi:hypothetical protein
MPLDLSTVVSGIGIKYQQYVWSVNCELFFVKKSLVAYNGKLCYNKYNRR